MPFPLSLHRCSPSLGQALTQPRICVKRSGALAASKSMKITPSSELLVRQYQAADYQAICDICRNVYDGTDYIPRCIAGYAVNPNTVLLVAQTQDEEQRVDGLICADKRQKFLFIFGLRVREASRGKGIGRLLVDALTHHSAHQHLGTITSTVAAVAPESVASARIFQRLNYDLQATVDMWPAGAALAEYESLIGFPEQKAVAGTHPCIIDHIPGARACVEAGSAAVGCSTSSWQRCDSMEMLEHAVSAIRQQQWHAAGKQPAPGMPPWLPWCYEPYPVKSSWAQERICAGEVWLLPTQACAAAQSLASCPADYAAVLVMTPSAMFRRIVAGIITSQDAFIAPALQFAATKALHFVSFVDRGCLKQGAAALVNPPAIFSTTPGRRQYYLQTKPAE